MADKPEHDQIEAAETKSSRAKPSIVLSEPVPSDPPATVLSDPAIRFQESRNVAQFLELMKLKGVRLKEAN
jgi:hypothetical protein